MSVAFPSSVACAVMKTGTKIVTCGVEVVAVIFLVLTYIDRILTELAVKGFPLACALVDNFSTVALPIT